MTQRQHPAGDRPTVGQAQANIKTNIVFVLFKLDIMVLLHIETCPSLPHQKKQTNSKILTEKTIWCKITLHRGRMQHIYLFILNGLIQPSLNLRLQTTLGYNLIILQLLFLLFSASFFPPFVQIESVRKQIVYNKIRACINAASCSQLQPIDYVKLINVGYYLLYWPSFFYF